MTTDWAQYEPSSPDSARSFRWKANGEARGHRSYFEPHRDHGVVEADNLPEALLLVLHRDLDWDGFSLESELAIAIEPVSSGQPD